MRIDVLDHGYLSLIETWGSEEAIIEAARMSTAKGFLGWGVPETCATYTPFEMAGATFEVQAPIFVFREWHRHRIPFGYNEMSARYTPLPDVNYIPTVERLMINSKTNKQAGVVAGAAELTEKHAEDFRHELADSYQAAESLYQAALKAGVPKELARVHLPVGRYSRMRATGNLRGWLAFLRLREAPGAQYEIRMYAHALHALLKEKFPRTIELFEERA